MLLRAPHSPARGTGWLTGWRLTFGGEDLGWEGALATVVEDDDPTSQVFVALYDITGSRAASLHAGRNDLGGLPPGVYYIRESSAVRKVIITR